MNRGFNLTLSAALALASSFGCATTQPSIDIANARRTLVEAQNGEAGRRAPAEVRVAQRTLAAAERAWENDPDSTEARDLAYISDRQSRIAMAHARRAAVAESTQIQRARYQEDLENTNLRTQDQLRSTEVALAAEGQVVQNQNQALQQQGTQLAQEREARAAAEARARTAMLRVAELAAVRTETNTTTITILGSLLFSSGRSELLPGATDRLTAVAEALAAQSDRQVLVAGYTDSRGSAAMNDALSLARAGAVVAFLVDHGVDAGRIRAVGRGSSQPVADNTSAEGRANNRRVEIILSPIEPR